MAIYGFSIVLIPRIKKQVGCNESLNDNLPNSQKKARGNVRKTAKSSSVQAREGKIQKEISICPNFSKDQLRDKKSLASFARICNKEKENHRAVLLFHILSSIFDLMLRFFSSSLSDIPVSAQCRPEGRSMQTGQSLQRCR